MVKIKILRQGVDKFFLPNKRRIQRQKENFRKNVKIKTIQKLYLKQFRQNFYECNNLHTTGINWKQNMLTFLTWQLKRQKLAKTQKKIVTRENTFRLQEKKQVLREFFELVDFDFQ